jgi:hypothetical protein
MPLIALPRLLALSILAFHLRAEPGSVVQEWHKAEL